MKGVFKLPLALIPERCGTVLAYGNKPPSRGLRGVDPLSRGAKEPLRPHGGRQIFRPVDRDVFVRDLNRQLGTPSHLLPVDSCKREYKEAP